VGDRAGEGLAYVNLGSNYLTLGRLKEAIEYHNKALSVTKEVDDRVEERTAYGTIGIANNSLGRFQRSHRVPQQNYQ